jgi:hypothetical protein
MPAPGLSWRLLRPGDVVVLVAGCAAVFTSVHYAWFDDTRFDHAWFDHARLDDAPASAVVVRAGGRVVDTVPLARNQTFDVVGALGMSRIEIHDRRVRVAADPSPRQLCVRQGWLTRAGDMAACLPNQVSVEILGSARIDTRVY